MPDFFRVIYEDGSKDEFVPIHRLNQTNNSMERIYCRFSGFFDKNENAIYAGDILQREPESEYFPVLVGDGEYEVGSRYMKSRHNGFYKMVNGNKDEIMTDDFCEDIDSYIVIGNIHSDKNLIEKLNTLEGK